MTAQQVLLSSTSKPISARRKLLLGVAIAKHLVARYQALITFTNVSGAWKIAGYEDVTIPTEPLRLDVAALHLNDYSGTYSYAKGHDWTVSVDHNVLSYTTHKGGKSNVLEPIGRMCSWAATTNATSSSFTAMLAALWMR